MNETQTKKIKHATWTITAYKAHGSKTWKVIAVSPDRKRVVHQDKLNDADLKTFDPAGGKKAPNMVDFAADLDVGKAS